MTTLMPLPEILTEIRSYAEFADSTDLEILQLACDDVKAIWPGCDIPEVVEAKAEVRNLLMCQYNAVAVAAKNLAAQ